ncbi:MAG: 2-iminoacetate synthase ThiH [Candidatus Omnitrophica bacterium]|nr:2-iminoacetate synthase ThiH [Candidatus Omnitrophota bacterium]
MKRQFITIQNIRSIIENNEPQYLENLAQQAQQLTQQHFGRTISLYAPLYLANFCSSYCTYCGFNARQPIHRFKLTPGQIQKEMDYLAARGIENILLLTGESYHATPLSYIKEAVQIAKTYFSSISIEIHPLEQGEYRQLFEAGVDGLTIYQETYNQSRYHEVHLSGKKKNYHYRRDAAKRAAQAGFRTISLGILLGLHDDVAEDVFSLYQHLHEMEQTFPGVEYSLSFPRLRSITGQEDLPPPISDKAFIKIICMTRGLFPRVGINLSTRETPAIRDHAIALGITRLSAESNTSVGGYTLKNECQQAPQFDICDHRSVAEIITMLKKHKYDPVLTDWRRIDNICTERI